MSQPDLFAAGADAVAVAPSTDDAAHLAATATSFEELRDLAAGCTARSPTPASTARPSTSPTP